jgi:O-acetyl-ADP-ribose deacetylase (regulator of RNase III)
VAVAAVADWLRANARPEAVTFCCFDEADQARYTVAVEALM